MHIALLKLYALTSITARSINRPSITNNLLSVEVESKYTRERTSVYYINTNNIYPYLLQYDTILIYLHWHIN